MEERNLNEVTEEKNEAEKAPMKKKSAALNVPNTLSFIRVLLVPVFVFTMLICAKSENKTNYILLLIPAAVFVVTSLTDMLDGQIARRCNLVTDFGKFIDPLADKFMVISSQIAIMAYMFMIGETLEAVIFLALVLLILLRELGVTSLRLVVAGKSGIVVAASIFGKLKTVSQMVGTILIILEPLVFPFCRENHVIAYIAMAVMAFTTIFSGIDYLRAYLPYIDTNK